MFDVVFYYNKSDDRVINKILEVGHTYQGVARDELNVMSPSITFEEPNVMRYNYAYIPALQRYYKIISIDAVTETLYEVIFEVDVLMSFRRHILQYPVIVDKQTETINGDEYIDDGSLVTDNVMFTTTYVYPNGFNDTPQYILITAG